MVAAAVALIVLGPGDPAPARDARPTGDQQDCLTCHRQIDPGMVRAWEMSVHERKKVGCAECHGRNHDVIFDAAGDVSSLVCAACHAVQVQDFQNSKHARAWKDMEENAMFQAQSPAVRSQTCVVCHSIGKPFPDGSFGKCNYCHTGHAFLADEARSPDACHTCHVGPNHPQQEAYDSSKHGVLWQQVRDTSVAPTCATCHMPNGTHDTSANMTIGDTIHGAVLEGDPVPFVGVRTISRARFEEGRGLMLNTCNACHSSRFARRSLDQADAVKREADELVAEARAIIEGLAAEDLLALAPKDRRPNPVHGHALVLGLNQLYEDTTVIEQRFFEMVNFYHANTFKGVYHNAPDFTHWSGIVPLKGALTDIRGEARRLREQARLRSAVGVEPPPATEQYTGALD